jgi:hypothetical protein
VPFGALLIVALIAIAAIALVMRSSETGSLKVRAAPEPGAPAGSEAMPRP